MRWLLARCCGLVLINLSVVLNQSIVVTQIPRFYSRKISSEIYIFCQSSAKKLEVQWYKANVDSGKGKLIQAGPRIQIRESNVTQRSILVLSDLHIEDSGVYFCKFNNLWGPGTGLQVGRPINLDQAQYRSKMKDGLIVFQGLLLALCIAAVLQRNRTLLKENDSIYEEPETDHIYEGLAIETCGGGLYEELSVYAQAEGAEAPWE